MYTNESSTKFDKNGGGSIVNVIVNNILILNNKVRDVNRE